MLFRSTYAADQPIVFTASFNRNITGIESADFVNQGTAIGCVISPQANSYSTSGSPININVSGCSEGTLILELSVNSVFHSTNVAAPSVPFRASTIIIDRTAPTVIIKNPADGASNVAVNANIVLTFSEVVTSQIGSVTVRKIDGTIYESLSVSDSQITGLGSDTITIDFDRDFLTSSH